MRSAIALFLFGRIEELPLEPHLHATASSLLSSDSLHCYSLQLLLLNA